MLLYAGSLESRGIRRRGGNINAEHTNLTKSEEIESNAAYRMYEMPCGMNAIRWLKCLRYLPISPTYGSKLSYNSSNEEEHSNEGFSNTEPYAI